ncbi:MAG TPA: hypothetical protein VHC45_09790 [Gaiellaceae bacterium]|jgi:hypothetical protein|nr:hypothetical protein [Gaiellaceae bacterium]HVV58643.1 hypothetical protein [Gaiellaceae bacterium]
MQKRILLALLIVVLAGAVAAAALATVSSTTSSASVSSPATTTDPGQPAPGAPTAYQPGDFVYTCDWIAAHPAAASAAHVSCDPAIHP